MKQTILFLFLLSTVVAHAQLRNEHVFELPDMGKNGIREVLRIPDIEGYKTLKCDFHVHTVFSDGLVWPNVRIDEAWMQGLDAIAITDHIEYRPHKKILEGDHNESFKIAKKKADEIGFIVIKGSEITRNKPLGHLNALFITDANALDVKDPLEAIDAARKQGGVILWNHPGWPDDKTTLYEVHEKLISEKKIDMVEVHNYTEYYPLAFDWINKYNIAPAATSDTHNAVMLEFGMEKCNRPVTLVFAKERSEASIKEALLSRRTAALFNNTIMAKEEWATKLFWASVNYRIISVKEGKALVEVENVSDVPFVIKDTKGDVFTLPANKIIRRSFNTSGRLTVTNVYVGHNRHLTFAIPKS